MHKGLASVIFFLFWVASASAAPVKIVSWNLEWFPGGEPNAKQADKKKHMKAAQEALKTLNPDVICLQEVKDWKAVTELVSVIPGLRVNIVSRFDGDQQQAIASKLPPDSAWAEKWKSADVADIPRGYSFAALRMPEGFVLVYSLHLKANGRGADAANVAKREASARQLIAHAADMQKLYSARGKVGIILAGDWNTALDSNPVFDTETTMRDALASGFRTAWENIPSQQRVTHPGVGGWPDITFDHILTAGLGTPVGKVVNFPGVSDHMPVIVEVAGITECAPIALAPAVPKAKQAEPSVDESEKTPQGPSFTVEEGLAPVPVREIIMTPPTFTDSIPGVKRSPGPATKP